MLARVPPEESQGRQDLFEVDQVRPHRIHLGVWLRHVKNRSLISGARLRLRASSARLRVIVKGYDFLNQAPNAKLISNSN